LDILEREMTGKEAIRKSIEHEEKEGVD